MSNYPYSGGYSNYPQQQSPSEEGYSYSSGSDVPEQEYPGGGHYTVAHPQHQSYPGGTSERRRHPPYPADPRYANPTMNAPYYEMQGSSALPPQAPAYRSSSQSSSSHREQHSPSTSYHPQSSAPSRHMPAIREDQYYPPQSEVYPSYGQDAPYGSDPTLGSQGGQRSQAIYQECVAQRNASCSLFLCSSSQPSSPNTERFICERCGGSFSRAHDRKRHYETQHAERPVLHRCRHCGREFNRADSLKRHRDNGCGARE